jgi:hypothetical protein
VISIHPHKKFNYNLLWAQLHVLFVYCFLFIRLFLIDSLIDWLNGQLIDVTAALLCNVPIITARIGFVYAKALKQYKKGLNINMSCFGYTPVASIVKRYNLHCIYLTMNYHHYYSCTTSEGWTSHYYQRERHQRLSPSVMHEARFVLL